MVFPHKAARLLGGPAPKSRYTLPSGSKVPKYAVCKVSIFGIACVCVFGHLGYLEANGEYRLLMNHTPIIGSLFRAVLAIVGVQVQLLRRIELPRVRHLYPCPSK